MFLPLFLFNILTIYATTDANEDIKFTVRI